MTDDLLAELTYATEIDTGEEKPTLGILAMGISGSGKTNLSSTAPMPLVLDYDHGLVTYTTNKMVKGRDYFPVTFDKFKFVEKKVGKDIKKVLKPNPNIDKTLQILAEAADKSGAFAPGGPLEKVETIVIDGYTSMSDYFLYEIMTSRLGLNYDNDKPGFEGYGQLQRALSNVGELLIACKKHYNIICTVLVKWEKRPGSRSDDDMIASPQIDGSFRNLVGKILDEFYYLEAKPVANGTTYLAHTQPLNTVPGLKSRSKLPKKVENISFEHVYKEFLKVYEGLQR